MDPASPLSKGSNLPNEENNQADPSFQVMPKEGKFVPTPEVRIAPAPPVMHSPVSDMQIREAPSVGGGRRFIYILIGILVLAAAGVGIYMLIGRKSSPSVAASKLPKVWLQQYFQTDTCTDLANCGDDADPDNDGLKNYDEFKATTSPTSPDTDGDGLADGDEINIYHTDPALKFTDRRPIVTENNWTDGVQVANSYDPITPGVKFTDTRKQQIADDSTKFGVHEPTTTTLSSVVSSSSPTPSTPVSGSPTPGTPAPSPAAAAPVTHQVTIQNMAFSPQITSVKKGDKVIWTNKDTVSHTVTGDSGGPNSPTIPPNGTYSYTFTSTGSATYHCTIHPTMSGTVIVN